MSEIHSDGKSSGKNVLSFSIGVVFSSYTLRKSVPTALVVGTFLNGINQFPHLLDHTPLVWSKVVLNYLVPFLVSSWSILSTRLSKEEQSSGEGEKETFEVESGEDSEKKDK
ncbi:MAG: conserved protein of unknown function [Leptospirillum rubarum]|nr:MAG: conserved hypothetical protein [Leptospirillum rubarum]EAY57746.1 MAG: conserved protein of unknown function [Leptospirillum rubarum]